MIFCFGGSGRRQGGVSAAVAGQEAAGAPAGGRARRHTSLYIGGLADAPFHWLLREGGVGLGLGGG